jgi:hypothetical protein
MLEQPKEQYKNVRMYLFGLCDDYVQIHLVVQIEDELVVKG